MRDFLWVVSGCAVALGLGLAAAFAPTVVVAAIGVTFLVVLASGTYKKFIRDRSDVPAAAWSPVLLMFPLVCSLRSVNVTFATVAMVGLLLLTLLRRPEAGRGYIKLPLLLMIVAVGLVISRPASVPSGLFIVLAIVVLLCAVSRTTRHSAVASIMDGLGLYLIANVGAYYVLGMRSAGAVMRTGGLESSDGGIRVLYPLATSLNLPPIMAAVFLSALLMLMESGPKRFFRVIAAGAAVVVLVSAESRSALIVAVLIAAASLCASRLLRGLALPIAIASLAFVFIYHSIARTIVAPAITAMTDAIPALSRGATSNSDVSLNGRETIWFQAIRYWTERTSEWGQIFGYGTQGQFESGASRTYAHIFGSSFQNPQMASTHNSVLQHLFDGGVLGVACLILAIIACVRLWVVQSRANEPYAAAALAATLSIVLSSVTEVSLAPGMGQETLLIFVGLLIVACSSDGDPASAPHDGMSAAPKSYVTTLIGGPVLGR